MGLPAVAGEGSGGEVGGINSAVLPFGVAEVVAGLGVWTFRLRSLSLGGRVVRSWVAGHKIGERGL